MIGIRLAYTAIPTRIGINWSHFINKGKEKEEIFLILQVQKLTVKHTCMTNRDVGNIMVAPSFYNAYYGIVLRRGAVA